MPPPRNRAEIEQRLADFRRKVRAIPARLALGRPDFSPEQAKLLGALIEQTLGEIDQDVARIMGKR